MSNFFFQVLVPPSEHHTIHTTQPKLQQKKDKTQKIIPVYIQISCQTCQIKYKAEWSMLVGHVGLKIIFTELN